MTKKQFTKILPFAIVLALFPLSLYLYSCRRLDGGAPFVPPAPPGSFLLSISLDGSGFNDDDTGNPNSCYENSIYFATVPNSNTGCNGWKPLCLGVEPDQNNPAITFNDNPSTIFSDEVALNVSVSSATWDKVGRFYSNDDIVIVDNVAYVIVSAPNDETSTMNVRLFDKCCNDGRLIWTTTDLDQIGISTNLLITDEQVNNGIARKKKSIKLKSSINTTCKDFN